MGFVVEVDAVNVIVTVTAVGIHPLQHQVPVPLQLGRPLDQNLLCLNQRAGCILEQP